MGLALCNKPTQFLMSEVFGIRTVQSHWYVTLQNNSVHDSTFGMVIIAIGQMRDRSIIA